MTNFIKPINRSKINLQGIGSYQPSSRIQGLETGSSKSIGASCNVFAVQDSIYSIAAAHAWAYQVMAYQGAPSIDFSNLRPIDSELSTGGYSSGAVSFMRPFDAIVSTMRRSEKKNGAGIAYLDWGHPELDSFLAADFGGAYKGVYIPMHDTPEAKAFMSQKETIVKLAKAYDNFQCFLVKRPLPIDHEPMFVNLCTEVEIPHRGTCVLGACNLSIYYSLEEFATLFPIDFTQAAVKLYQSMLRSQQAAASSPLVCHSDLNNQFGLGVFGLASALAKFGIRYSDLAYEMHLLFASFHEYQPSTQELRGRLKMTSLCSPARMFLSTVIDAYALASRQLGHTVRAAFCIQPTVSTAQRCYDSSGYHVSPEIQPVRGLRHADAVSTIIKSAIKGDSQVDYHPDTETIDDVPMSIYSIVAAGWQMIMNSTGLAHRHSFCWYGDSFYPMDLKNLYDNWMLKNIKSLYYRLPNNANTEAMKKDTLWQDTGDIAADIDLSQFCTIDDSTCDCQM